MTGRIRGSFALIPEWAEVRIVDGTAMRLYVRLARKYADRERHAFPFEDELARELGCSESTVKRCVRILREADVLIVDRERKADGSYGRNLYYLPTEDPREAHQGSNMTCGQGSNIDPGSDQAKRCVSPGRQDRPPGVKYDLSEEQPDPGFNQTSEAKASGDDADAPHRESDTGSSTDDLFASWPGCEAEEDQNRQEEGGARSASKHSFTNGAARRSSDQYVADDHAPRAPSAQDAVREWHDAFGSCRPPDVKPTRQQLNQVGREAKELLDAGNDPSRVLAITRDAGREGWSTLKRQFAMTTGPPGNGNGYRRNGHVPYENPTDQRVYEGSIR